MTTEDLNQVKGRRDALLAKLQERYGIGRKAAESQIEDWMQPCARTVPRRHRSDGQRQSIELVSGQVRKAMELPMRLTECRDPIEVAKIQADFAQTFVSDCFEGAQKMLSVLTAATEHLAHDRNEAVRQQVQQLTTLSSR